MPSDQVARSGSRCCRTAASRTAAARASTSGTCRRELVALGHHVEVFSGQPYPELDPGRCCTEVPSLDLYREPRPVPHAAALREYRDWIDVLEVAHDVDRRLPRAADVQPAGARGCCGPAAATSTSCTTTRCSATACSASPGRPAAGDQHPPPDQRRPPDRARRAPTAWRSGSPCAAGTASSACRRRVARRRRPDPDRRPSPPRRHPRDFGVDPDRMRVVPLGVDTGCSSRPHVPRVPGRIVADGQRRLPDEGRRDAAARRSPSCAPSATSKLDRGRQADARAAPPSSWSSELALGERGALRARRLRRRARRARSAAPRWPSCPRSTRASRCPPSRHMACGTPLVASHRRRACPRWSGRRRAVLVAARRRRGAGRRAARACSTTRTGRERLGAAGARGCWSGSPGAPSPRTVEADRGGHRRPSPTAASRGADVLTVDFDRFGRRARRPRARPGLRRRAARLRGATGGAPTWSPSTRTRPSSRDGARHVRRDARGRRGPARRRRPT